MSSVSGSDSSSGSSAQQNDVIRRNREEAARAETELVKKHQKEIRRINEEHYAEVENLKKDHVAQMEDLRKVSHEDINERDHKYQSEIEGMRGMYKKQLQTQADETSRKDDAQKLAKVVDDGSEKANHEARLTKLNEDYQKNLEARNKEFENALAQNREAEDYAITNNRDKLTRQFTTENKTLNQERKAEVEGLQKNFGDYKQYTTQQLKDQEVAHLQEKRQDSENLLRAVNREREASNDNSDTLREGFKDGLNKTRERYEKAYGMDRGAGEAARQQMKESVRERVDGEVNRLKMAKVDVDDSSQRKEVAMKQQQKREIADIQESYQKNIDNYKDQRDAALGGSNDRLHRSVERIRKETADQAVEQSRFYRQEEDQQNRINRTALDNLKGDFNTHNDQAKNTADERVKSVYENAADEKARMSALESENHTASQRSHQDDMIALRSALEADKQSVVSSLNDRLQKQELQHSERMSLVVGKYEKQIQTLKDQMMREKRQGDENLKRSVEEMQRVHKTSVDQIEAQNRDRMHMADNAHTEELRNLNKRNEQKINEVLSEVKKS